MHTPASISVTRSAETGQRTYVNPPTHESQGVKKITLNDWLLHNQHLSTTGQNLRNDCIGSIQKSHASSDGVILRTGREQKNTTNNLSTRLNHVERSTDNLEVSNDLLDKEIFALEQVKADTEQMLQCVQKCVTGRLKFGNFWRFSECFSAKKSKS